ncbi:MAG: XkdX family protein [Clostridiales bacterium]|nr:XkdX family protein [Clostridiales bacterium]
MSAKYSKVKGYYDAGLWSKNQVRNAVIKSWITEDEYREITGEDYV